MRTTGWAVILAAGVLAACGGSEPQDRLGAPGGPGGKPKASKSNASAEEVAEEARGRVKCPARIKSAPRAEGTPVDDVVGVRPGMTYEEAANVVLCTNDLLVVQADTSQRFNIQTYGQTLRQGFSARFAEPYVVKDSRQYMREMGEEFAARSGNAVRQDMKPGQSKWYVSTMGMPEQEKVIAAAREEWFEEGKNPTLASVEQALLKKYGTPTRTQKNIGGIYLTWAYDPFGRLVTETSPLFNNCAANPSPDGGTSFSPDCGIAVAAKVSPLRDNPQLSQYLQVGVNNHAVGYEAITGTEQALQQMDAQRVAKEVAEASKNADKPQL